MAIECETIFEELKIFSITASDEVVNKMKELCILYNCEAESIVENWIAFAATKNFEMQPTLDMLNQMEKEMMSKKISKTPKSRKSQSHVSSSMCNSNMDDSLNESSCNEYQNIENAEPHLSLVSRCPGPFSPNSISPFRTPSTKYVSRNASEILLSYGEKHNVDWKHTDEFSCSVESYLEENTLHEHYSYMFEKLHDCASVLNDMIYHTSLIYAEKYEINEWGHFHLPCMEDVSVVGRICSSLDSDKLNSASLSLEGSQEICSGLVVPLDVSNLEKYSLFPGQIIAGKGINSLGKKLILNSIYDGIFPPFSKEIPNLSNCLDSLSVVVAAGPFTTSDSLLYEPLNDLLKYIKDHKPHACILIGPLVDEKHKQIEKCNVPETVEDTFQNLISNIFKKLEDTITKIILVPSSRDAHHDFIYPTPPYRIQHHSKKFFLASDPCLIKIEGVIFGITSTDILFHLGKEEITYPPQTPDRLGRLCSHILMQKNFYPLYPPNEDINIDYLHYESHAILPIMPHILIVPSDLRYFIKDINGCCCINPERLTKRLAGGTFARLKIKRFSAQDFSGSINEFIQAEIVKI